MLAAPRPEARATHSGQNQSIVMRIGHTDSVTTEYSVGLAETFGSIPVFARKCNGKSVGEYRWPGFASPWRSLAPQFRNRIAQPFRIEGQRRRFAPITL